MLCCIVLKAATVSSKLVKILLVWRQCRALMLKKKYDQSWATVEGPRKESKNVEVNLCRRVKDRQVRSGWFCAAMWRFALVLPSLIVA